MPARRRLSTGKSPVDGRCAWAAARGRGLGEMGSRQGTGNGGPASSIALHATFCAGLDCISTRPIGATALPERTTGWFQE